MDKSNHFYDISDKLEFFNVISKLKFLSNTDYLSSAGDMQLALEEINELLNSFFPDVKERDEIEENEYGKLSDVYQKFEELYEFRMLYNALALNSMVNQGINMQKCIRDNDGELCFGGGWFVVIAELPEVGQISNHYNMKYWDLFNIPSVENLTIKFDGHTSIDVTDRIKRYLSIKNK